jgi:hypothetical protein
MTVAYEITRNSSALFFYQLATAGQASVNVPLPTNSTYYNVRMHAMTHSTCSTFSTYGTVRRCA